MKLTDYIISFLAEKGVTDIFGYPGGCINHLIDSAFKHASIKPHLAYNEQGAAFAACGYAQKSNKLGVAYSTSGPGATNLITGVASAYFDSIPALFITGNVDSPAEKGTLLLRQRGFQETDVVSCVKSITKWAVHVDKAEDIKYYLEKAYYVAFEGNPGPVLLDIPNDLQRTNVDIESLKSYVPENDELQHNEDDVSFVLNAISKSARPVILAGNGIKQNKLTSELVKLAEKLQVPVVTGMASFDLLANNHPLNFGFIGTNGHRYANFITEKADLVLVLGNRMSIRPLGIKRELFAPNAVVIRVDIDQEQLNYKFRDNQIAINADLKQFLPTLLFDGKEQEHGEWLRVCNIIKNKLKDVDLEYSNKIIARISDIVPAEYDITSDIGQNLVWLAQSFKVKEGQTVCMSTGNGPMGYSVPAGIGVFCATGRPVASFCGDGGLMMNLQELQFIKREQISNKIICLNNISLGMIRSWQARYLDSYAQTTIDSGYNTPDFKKIADAFDLKYTLLKSIDDVDEFCFTENCPELIEVIVPTEIETEPNGNMHDQNPQISRELYNEIMNL